MSTTAELVSRMREEFLRDTVGEVDTDFMWPDAAIVSALNSAEVQIARRLLCIEDRTTAGICRIPVVAAPAAEQMLPADYPIDARIIKVVEVRAPGVPQPLAHTNDNYYNGVAYQVFPGRLWISRRPAVTGDIELTVRRLPLKQFRLASGDGPELQYMDDALCYAACAQLYMRPDPETYDSTLAGQYSALFERELDKLKDTFTAQAPEVRVMRPDCF